MKDYFCGWYLKVQNECQTLALIPAYHITGGQKSCSVQIITGSGAWNIPFEFQAFYQDENSVQIGKNEFTRQGVTLDLEGSGVEVKGSLEFGPLSPIRYDIMGPFQYIPFLECRHSIFSMKHAVSGSLWVNGQHLNFDGGLGYMEGDRGHSFPNQYVWTQCCFPEGSLMLSVADIPFCGFHFTGVIGVILYQGKEYRLATYLGARAVRIQEGEVVVRQGNQALTARCLEEMGHPLAAPVGGKMSRTIHEAPACRAYFHYQIKGRTVLEFESRQASFEYEFPG